LASQFQNRLIGSVILVSLGVIFLPDILTGKPKTPTVPVAAIPLQPEASPLPRPETVSQAQSLVVAASASAAQSESWQMEEVAAPVTLNGREPDANQVVPAGTVVAAAPQPSAPQGTNATPAQAVTAPPVADKPAAQSSADSQSLTAQVKVTQPKPVAPTAKPVAQPAQPVAQAKPAAKPAYEIKPFAPDAKPVAPQIKPVAPATQVNSMPTATASATSGGRVGGVEVVEAQPSMTKPVAPVSSRPVAASPSATASGGSWIIQLGVFQNGDNARSLVGRLRAAGYAAGIQLVKHPQGLLHRVVVGPDVSRARLEAMLPKVNQASGTAGKVIAYSPAG